ncbi:hypothetical protein PFISCL1PPCAC_1200, partial [Pristionchus fissidentatus]
LHLDSLNKRLEPRFSIHFSPFSSLLAVPLDRSAATTVHLPLLQLPYTMAMSKARKIVLIMNIVSIPFSIVNMALGLFISSEFFLCGIGSLIIAIFGICGVCCKNTCLIMTTIVFLIIDMINKATMAYLLISIGTAAELNKAAVAYLAKHPTSDVAAFKGLVWATAILTIIEIVFEAILTHFSFKARKEIKQEEFGAFMGGYPVPSGSVPSSGGPPRT